MTATHASNVERMMEQVDLRAKSLLPDDHDERPGLHDLMQALDLIIQESPGDQESTEVANTVYRLLIKKEKQKAYNSLLTIQSEIYEMQGKSNNILHSYFSTIYYTVLD